MDRRRSPVAAVLAVALAILSLSGCGRATTGSPMPSMTDSGTPTAGPTTSTSSAGGTAPENTVPVSVYLMREGKLIPTRRAINGPAVAAEAVRALLAGPTQAELKVGMATAIPAATTLNSVSLGGGTATVDLSRAYESGGGTLSMTGRLAQLVFTLTQFPSVQRVSFRLDAQPVTVFSGEGIVLDHPSVRNDFEDVLPAVLVESPTVNATTGSPLRVYGSANVFEAVFRVQVVDHSGQTLTEPVVRATSGTGTRGTFDVTLRFSVPEPGRGRLIAWYASSKDGSRVVVTEIPIDIRR